MQIIKRLTNKITTIVLVIALSLAMIVCAFSFNLATARADGANDTKEFEPTDLGIGNTDFRDSSGSYPASPTNWTGSHVGTGDGEVVAGVVDLTTSTYNNESDNKKGNEKYKLDQYPEFENGDIPRTIFGTSGHKDTDAKALLINTPKGSETAYAYTSSTMTFAPDSFYYVSVWVKTGDFAGGTGATIKLNGLGENCAFYNINTVAGLKRNGNVPILDDKNNFGWKEYTFLVRTGYSISHSVTLSLGIGDAYLGDDEDSTTVIPSTAHGYAFFDNVKAEQISAESYAFLATGLAPDAERGNVYYDNTKTCMALDLYDGEYLTDENGNEIGTFSDHNLAGWDKNASYDDNDDEIEYGGEANAFYYPAAEDQDVNTNDNGKVKNDYGMTSNPWTPYGRAEGLGAATDNGYKPFATDDAGILALSTYSHGEFARSAIGVASPDVTVKQYKYYRFGVWVKGDSISGGDGISIGVKGQSNIAGNDNKLNQWYPAEGNSSDTAHYGWKEKIIYIQGSMLSDLTVHFELWLGSPSQKSAGIAYFDNVTFKELTYSEYIELSSEDGGEIISLDGIVDDTGINNGNFMAVDSSDDMSFPLPVADWTFRKADEFTSAGFASNPVNADSVIHGIIPTDEATFDNIPSKDIVGIVNPESFGSDDELAFYSALVISSAEKTAVCYASSEFSLESGNGYKLYVDMAVDHINGYGAALVLKSGGRVISTIEEITSTDGAYNRYTFYIDELNSAQAATIEIWLGLNDRVNNSYKLSAGSVYVKRVGLEAWEAAEDSTVSQEYASLLEQYNSDVRIPARRANMNYGVYSFNVPSFDYYDPYSYNLIDGLNMPYLWSATPNVSGGMQAGVIDSANPPSQVYAGFDRKEYTGNMLYVANTSPNKTTVTYDNTISLTQDTYYRLDVAIKVRIPDDDEINPDTAVGASIKLIGAQESAFTNIKDTASYVIEGREDTRDAESFKIYTFYIATGSAGGNISLEFALGGDDFTKYIQGVLVVSDIKLTTISNVTFEAVEDELKDSDNEDATRKVIRFSTDEDEEDPVEEDTKSNDIAWWIIPTVIFSACLVIAIIVVAAMKIKESVDKKRKHNKKYTNEYDRNDAMREIEKLKAADEKDAAEEEQPAKVNLKDEFDDDYSEADETVENTETETTEQDGNTEEPETAENTEEPKSEEKAEEPKEQAPAAPTPSDDLDD